MIRLGAGEAGIAALQRRCGNWQLAALRTANGRRWALRRGGSGRCSSRDGDGVRRARRQVRDVTEV
jgi:hypothetical protein